MYTWHIWVRILYFRRIAVVVYSFFQLIQVIKLFYAVADLLVCLFKMSNDSVLGLLSIIGVPLLRIPLMLCVTQSVVPV